MLIQCSSVLPLEESQSSQIKIPADITDSEFAHQDWLKYSPCTNTCTGHVARPELVQSKLNYYRLIFALRAHPAESTSPLLAFYQVSRMLTPGYRAISRGAKNSDLPHPIELESDSSVFRMNPSPSLFQARMLNVHWCHF